MPMRTPKNLSILYRAGNDRLAPFYDLLSTAVYPGLNNRFAMKVGGQKDPHYLARVLSTLNGNLLKEHCCLEGPRWVMVEPLAV